MTPAEDLTLKRSVLYLHLEFGVVGLIVGVTVGAVLLFILITVAIVVSVFILRYGKYLNTYCN